MNFRKALALIPLLACFQACAQPTPWGLGLTYMPNAYAGRNYMGVIAWTNGAGLTMTFNSFSKVYTLNAIGGGGGSGTVTNFQAGNLSPLFTTSVSASTTYPSLSFSQVAQSANLFFAGPVSGAAANPTFRAITTNDLPAYVLNKLDDAPSDGNVYGRSNATWAIVGSGSGTGISTNSGSGTNNYFTTPTIENASFAGFQTNFIPGNDMNIGAHSLSNVFSLSAASSAFSIKDSTGTGRFGFSTAQTFLGDTGGVVRITAKNGGATQLRDKNGTNWLSADTDGLFVQTNAAAAASLAAFDSGDHVTRLLIGSGLSSDGTTLTAIGGGGGGGTAGIDRPVLDMQPYSEGTNFYLDFNYQAATLSATGSITFRYSTNWPTGQTNRILDVYIPPTNTDRTIYLSDSATNWNIAPSFFPWTLHAFSPGTVRAEIFTPGSTNVTFAFTEGDRVIPNSSIAFDPTSLAGLALWFKADAAKYFDPYPVSSPIVVEGSVIARWNDSGPLNLWATNNGVSRSFIYLPHGAPNGYPAVYNNGITAVSRLTTSAISMAKPVWTFALFKSPSPSGLTVLLDGNSSGTRMFIQAGAAQTQLYAGTSLTAGGVGTNWVLISTKSNGASSIIRTNGVQAASGNSGAQVLSGIGIGGDYSGANGFPGLIAEILIYTNDLSASDIGNIETNYFKTKYGLSIP